MLRGSESTSLPWSAVRNTAMFCQSIAVPKRSVFYEINMATFLSAKTPEDLPRESTFANTLGPTWGAREKGTLCLKLAFLCLLNKGLLALGV